MQTLNIIVLVVFIVSLVLLTIGASLVDIKNSKESDDDKMKKVQRAGIVMVVVSCLILASLLGFYGYGLLKK
jgi:heme/copper-type cytochrome/quinol oxidase subunit 2